MYNADDAIARVDSYIVSVGGAGPHVGERRMVRIETVARSAATAVLLDANGDVVEGRNGGAGRVRATSARRRAAGAAAAAVGAAAPGAAAREAANERRRP